MRADEYVRHDATALAGLIASGEVSREAVFEAALARIAALNPRLNAVVAERYDRARAELPDLSGPFAGVPFLVKDMVQNIAGMPTTNSTRLLASHVWTEDTELVTRYRAAGLSLLGRTNTPELGLMGVTEPDLRGPCRNPWDPDHTPGGSSGGAASAVAARMVPVAHAGDGGGSIRIPASACGLVGLKPTRARIPMGPLIAERWSGQVVEHVVCRSVRDCAALLDATHGAVDGAPYVAPSPDRPFLEEVGAPVGTLTIGWSDQAIFGSETHPEAVAAVERSVALLESLGHRCVRIHPTIDRHELARTYLTIVASAVAAGVRDISALTGATPTSRDFETATWAMRTVGERLPAGLLMQCIERARRTGLELAPLFQQVDVFVTPTTAFPSVRIGELALGRTERLATAVLSAVPSRRLMRMALDRLAEESLSRTPNTMLFNMSGHPAMSVPLHRTAAGLPLGTQLVGRFGDEATLFRLAAQLEDAQPWDDALPPLAAP